MDLPKPPGPMSLMSYSNWLGRQSMPKGSGIQTKTTHTPKQGRSTNTVHFSMDGECKGPLAEVMDLGLRLAQSAAEEGDESRALLIIDRIERLPTEYELRAKLSELKAINTIMKRAG